MESDRQRWLQLAGQRLDPASYILARHELTGAAVVVFKKGYLAQQAELGLQDEPIVWQSLDPAAAFSVPVDVTEMEFCNLERVEYHFSNPELGRGKRKRRARGPYLSLLLARRSALAGQHKLGLRLEHHVHIATPDFIIGRERFEASLSRPLLPQQRVKMLWRDAVDPARSEWYTGTVVQEAEEWGPPAGAIWEGVSVMWDTDSSITHVSPWELTPLLPQQLPQQQQQQQKVHEQLSGAHLRGALQSVLASTNASQRSHGQRTLLQLPALHIRQEPLGLGPLPRVDEHPNHLPQLHLRGSTAQESGHKVPSGSTLAEPGSGVSADTPGALPWGQQPSQGQQKILGPGWALAQQHSLAQQQSLGDQQLASLQRFVEQQQQQQQQLLGQQSSLGQQQSLGDQQLASLQRFLEQQQQQLLGQQESLGQQPSLGQQQSLGEQQLLSLQQLIEQQQQQQPSLGLEQSAGWRQFLAQHQSVGMQPPLIPHSQPERGSVQQALRGGSGAGIKAEQQEGAVIESLNGVRAVPGVNGATVYAAFLPDDRNVERTLEVFPTPQEAAKAHDVAALRQHGSAAEPMLNHPLDSYSEVLSEMRAYRRTNSTDDLDSPASNPESPGWVMNMRSQSLLALGIAPGSPHTQRQLIASGGLPVPAVSFGAKQLPEPASRASSSRLAALVDQMPVPNEEGDPSAPEQHAVHATGNGGKNKKDSGREGCGMSISRNGGKHRPSRSPPHRLMAAAGKRKPLPSAPSASAPSSSCQDASSSSDVSSNEEEAQEELSSWGDEEDWAPLQSGDLRVGLRARPRRTQKDAKADEEEAQDDDAQINEEEWTGSPVARSSRTVKAKGGVRKSSISTNPRVLAARKATTGGRKRSEKLTNFSGVTLKNGRIAVMLWNPQTKKPIHLGYWPSSLAAGRIADKARLSADFRRNDVDLNFPEGDYSLEELPNSIAQLADFIREEQSGARAAEPKAAPDSSSSRRRGAASSKSAAVGRVRFSHYLGVSWDRQAQVWQARAHKPDGTAHCIGDYPEEEAAARTYDEYALQHHGNGAVRNFPPSTYTGRASDDEEAYPCLKQYAADGDDWLINHVPTSRHARANKTRPQSAAARSPAAAASSAATAATTAVTTGPGSAPLRRLRSSAKSARSE